MIICHCNYIKDREVRAAIRAVRVRQPDAPVVPADIYDWLDRRPECGKCASHMARMIDEDDRGADEASGGGPAVVLQAIAAE